MWAPLPDWSSDLRNLYWHLRYCRKFNQACRRRHYRKIAVEKKRLTESGVDSEELRLLCRYLSNPRNGFAEARYFAYAKQLRFSLDDVG